MDQPFEFDGAKYRRASAGQKEWGRGLIEQLRLNGDERILDLGCGDGVITAELAALVPKGSVLGIDASQGMLDEAGRYRLKNLAFRKMDMRELKFENVFDLVFSNAALHWVQNHEPLLSGVYHALSPQGSIAFNFAGRGTCQNFFQVIRSVMQWAEYADCFRDFEWPWYMPDPDIYKRKVEQAGFVGCRVRGENRDRSFSSADELIRWIDQPTIVPFLRAVPDECRDAFRDCVVAEMLDAARQPDGTYKETFRRICVTALKP